MTRLYDLMLLIDPNAPDGRQQQVMGEVQSMIEAGATLVGSHDWGERRMAYEIDHRPDAHYHLFQFETESNELLERIQHQLKIMDGVLRFRVIRLKPGQPTPPPPRDTFPRERREEREPEGRVAARAAADAAPEGEEAGLPAEAPAVPDEAVVPDEADVAPPSGDELAEALQPDEAAEAPPAEEAPAETPQPDPDAPEPPGEPAEPE
jgi:small subunit ribosomal protein S6